MTDVPVYRPRRSVLYLPASNERALAKAATLPVDGLILDLEDAVSPGDKDQARENACAAASSGRYGAREVTIRVNGPGTEWHDDDLAAACAAGPDGIVVPKVADAERVRHLARSIERHQGSERTRLWVMVETPGAVLAAADLARASDRLAAIVLGTNDLVKELGARHVPGRAPIQAALQQVLLAGRAAGVAVLDGVYNDVRDIDGFTAECRQGRDLGFDGKTLVHPSQVDPCNAAFSPSTEEVSEARGILAAWDDGAGRGVVVYRGRMVESLHVDMARRVLAVDAAVNRSD
ncbi:MAG: HpcH/HpaI aldolase/citrate lyase family protein [Dermatophilaceae bacterium]